jgi:RNA polymerase sigma factor (sigma-70 family)
MIFDNASPCQHILQNRSGYIDSLYNSCFEKVKRMVMNNAGTEEDAHDVFQDAFIVLFKKCQDENFVLSAHPCTYLFRVSNNIWLKKLKERRKEVKNRPKLSGAQMDDLLSDHAKRESIVAKYFLLLGEQCRQILQLTCIEDLLDREAAEKLALTHGYFRVAKKRCIDGFFRKLNNDSDWNDLKVK